MAVDWGWGRDQNPSALLLRARAWLHAYFDGVVEPLTLPLAPFGTPYRHRIWAAIRAIPPGTTWTYETVAQAAGGSARSVGGAMAANPIPVLIPCHRVVSCRRQGHPAIGGYSGGDGIETKQYLLDLERRAVSQSTDTPIGGVRRDGAPCQDSQDRVTR